jgi:hypothetical protein
MLWPEREKPMSNALDDDAIQIRGRIYAKSPTYTACKSAPAKKVFKTLLVLAEEASIVREAVTKSSFSHPLEEKLSRMSSAEVVFYLMGLTQKFIEDQTQNTLNGIPQVILSGEQFSGQTQLQHKGQFVRTADHVEGAFDKPSELEMDADLLESFASFPSK